ncbi:MAG: GntR family transcriptional regulator [Pirellulales bacterium]|nr:GntR family transcriptional regulator [Pirellulales bacterium]
MATKTAQAYRQIKRLIEGGHVPTGKSLSEAKIAQMVGMTRSPVRESLLRLEAEGLLQRRDSGYGRVVAYVEDQDPEDMLRRYELREEIESGAARLAAKNMTGWQIDRLRELAEIADAARQSGNTEARYQASGKFHDYLIENCGNDLFGEVWRTHRLAPPQPRSREMTEKISAKSKEHDSEATSLLKIVDAIAAHDPDRAASLFKERLRRVTELLRQLVLKKNGEM